MEEYSKVTLFSPDNDAVQEQETIEVTEEETPSVKFQKTQIYQVIHPCRLLRS
jgi:hypothetical protein